jgi:acetolactate synthase-1/2/3 large subunit
MPPQNGGELVARMLQAEGVEVVFGIIDGSYFGLTSSLEKHGIRLVSPRHESSAAHMAGAYARLTGRLGVCIASNGPGAANVLPGIAVENGEGNRVLVLTSWRRAPIVGPSGRAPRGPSSASQRSCDAPSASPSRGDPVSCT